MPGKRKGQTKMHATFVIPALGGCNLSCPYCAIGLRSEAKTNRLTDEMYVSFLEQAIETLDLRSVGIVGYEPTLPKSLPLAIKMLTLAKQRQIQTSLNTNGVRLSGCAEVLARCADKIFISLDSAIQTRNDKMRGSIGAWNAAIKGIGAATKTFGYKRVFVNTLLIPKNIDDIKHMPKLLKTLGVRNWIVSPYINFAKGQMGVDLIAVRNVLDQINEIAFAFDIDVRVADEFRILGPDVGMEVLNFQCPGGENELAFRLSPNGSLSVSQEILRDSQNVRRWAGEDVLHFLTQALKEYAVNNRQPLRRSGACGLMAA
jgi:MoaA/NifB/PqqE/SkfB family radical SAM enzyme